MRSFAYDASAPDGMRVSASASRAAGVAEAEGEGCALRRAGDEVWGSATARATAPRRCQLWPREKEATSCGPATSTQCRPNAHRAGRARPRHDATRALLHATRALLHVAGPRQGPPAAPPPSAAHLPLLVLACALSPHSRRAASVLLLPLRLRARRPRPQNRPQPPPPPPPLPQMQPPQCCSPLPQTANRARAAFDEHNDRVARRIGQQLAQSRSIRVGHIGPDGPVLSDLRRLKDAELHEYNTVCEIQFASAPAYQMVPDGCLYIAKKSQKRIPRVHLAEWLRRCVKDFVNVLSAPQSARARVRIPKWTEN